MTTPLDALITAVRDAASYNSAAEAPPEAVVWCDANGDFVPLLPALRERLPELLTYGDFDPATRTGPAIWLRAAAAGAVSSVSWPGGAIPIIYIPANGREALKAADDCPALLQPLIWLTVAGNFFGHVNGKDWTLRGFLAAERGALKLTVPDDGLTRAALAHCALRFCMRPVEELRGKRWDADALNDLLSPDLAADMLDWINGGFTKTGDAGRFAAFAGIATKELSFDPRKLSRQDATKRLAKREGRWADVWARFSGSTGYSGVVGFLGLEEPGTLFEHLDSYPKLNAKSETKLREQLAGLAGLSTDAARAKIGVLENEHSLRR